MTVEHFNKLSLDRRCHFISKQLGGQDYGICNTLVFKDKIIIFLCAATTGKCYEAEAIYKPEKFIDNVQMHDKHCINIIQDSTPAIKRHLFGVYQKMQGKNN